MVEDVTTSFQRIRLESHRTRLPNLHGKTFSSTMISLYVMNCACGICLITARKRSLGQGSVFTLVCHSIQGGWPPSMHHRSHDQGGVWIQEVCIGGWGSASREGVCVQDGLYPRVGGRPPSTTGKAGGTYPTGMHSCLVLKSVIS